MRNVFVIAGIGLGLFCAAFVSAQATRPATGVTMHDWFRVVQAEHERLMLASYEADVPDHVGKPFDRAARAFFKRMAVRLTKGAVHDWYWPDIDTSNQTLLPMLDAVLDAGCDQPLLFYFKACLLLDSDDGKAAFVLQNAHLPRLLKSKCTDNYKIGAITQYIYDFDHPDPAMKNAVLTELVPAIVAFCRSPVADPIELRRRVDLIDTWCGKSPPKTMDTVIERLMADPAVDRWLVNVLRGHHQIALAWEARGTGLAHTVTREGWESFRQSLQQARDALLAAHQLRPTFPEAATSLIRIGMAEGGPLDVDANAWFETAIANQIDYMPAWHAMSWALRPRWGGSVDRTYALGLRAMRTARYDTEVPNFFLTTLGNLDRQEGVGDEIFATPEVWRNARLVFEHYIEGAKTQDQRDWRRSCKAYIAYRCGFYAETIAIADELGDCLAGEAFNDSERNVDEVLRECRARVSAQSKAIDRALVWEKRQQFERGVQAFSQLATDADADPAARLFARSHAAMCHVRAEIAAGRAVDLPTKNADDLEAWVMFGEPWTLVDGHLRASPVDKAFALCRYRTLMPRNASIECEFRLDGTPLFVLLLEDLADNGQLGISVLEGRIRLGTKEWVTATSEELAIESGQWHTLKIERHDLRTLSVHLNGKVVLARAKTAWLTSGRPQLALLAQTHGDGSSVEVRNIRAIGNEHVRQ